MVHAKRSLGICAVVTAVVVVVVVVTVIVVGCDGIECGEDEQDVLVVGVSGVPEFDQNLGILIARGTEATIGMRRRWQGRSDPAPRSHGRERRRLFGGRNVKTRHRRASVTCEPRLVKARQP